MRAALPATDNVGYPFLARYPNSTKSHSTVQKDFVQTVRAVEEALGIRPKPSFNSARNMTATLQTAAEDDYSDEVKSVLRDSAPVLLKMALEYGRPDMVHDFPHPDKVPLMTKYVYLFRAPARRVEAHCSLVASWTYYGSMVTVRTLLTPRMVLRPTTTTFTIALE